MFTTTRLQEHAISRRIILGAMPRGERPRAAWMQTFSLLHVVWRFGPGALQAWTCT